MSNKQKGYVAEDFTHVTPALITRIEAVVADKDARRYSTSNIYKAHNELFKLKEVQQNCATCLVIRASALKKWLDWHNKTAAPEVPEVQIPVQNVGPDGLGDPNLVTGGAPDSMPVADPITGEPTGQTVKPAADTAVVNPTNTPEQTEVAARVAAMVGEDGLTNEQRASIAAELIIPAVGEQATQADGSVIKNVGPVVGVQGPAQIILQKIDPTTYQPTGEPLYGVFTAKADDANKGTVTNPETGKALAAGTYATADITKILAVSVGGNATYKDVPTA